MQKFEMQKFKSTDQEDLAAVRAFLDAIETMPANDFEQLLAALPWYSPNGVYALGEAGKPIEIKITLPH